MFDEISSELAIVKNCNSLFINRIINLEKSVLNASQYHRREIIEGNPVPEEINEADLEESVCKALTLTDHKVVADDLQACHRMKRKGHVIVKFKNRKLKHQFRYDCLRLTVNCQMFFNSYIVITAAAKNMQD